MDVRLSLTSGARDLELEDLRDWLRLEPELRGRIRPVAEPPAPGQLGAVTDALMVALGSGGAISVLVASLQSWFVQTRRSDVRVVIQMPDGRQVEVDAKRVRDPDAVIASVLDGG